MARAAPLCSVRPSLTIKRSASTSAATTADDASSDLPTFPLRPLPSHAPTGAPTVAPAPAPQMNPGKAAPRQASGSPGGQSRLVQPPPANAPTTLPVATPRTLPTAVHPTDGAGRFVSCANETSVLATVAAMT